jgi:hypothetical protein
MDRDGIRRSALSALVLLSVAGAGTDAGAATITSIGSVELPGGSTGSIGPVGATPSPNDDNAVAASPNGFPLSIFFNDPGFAEIELALASSGGTTEYQLTLQPLVNNSGASWSGFRFELGFGTGTAFVPSGAGDGLDFDAPERDPAPTSSVFASLDAQDDSLEWSGGSVPSVGTVVFTFAIDVPVGLENDTFTLRLLPVAVAEPAPLALLGLGFAGIARSRRAPRAA